MKQILNDFMDWVIDEEGMTTNEKRTPSELFVNDYLASEKGKQALSLFGVVRRFSKEDLTTVYRIGFNHAKACASYQGDNIADAIDKAAD